MQREKRLYNVDNRHQCLRDSRSTIVRFFRYAPHFYGCTLCGQYHICHLREKTCVVVTHAVSQRLTCQYSGQLLHQSEALVPNVYDEGNDDAPLSSTTQSHSLVGGDGMCYTNMGQGRNKRARHDRRRQEETVCVTTITKTVYQKHDADLPPSLDIATEVCDAPLEDNEQQQQQQQHDYDEVEAVNDNNKTYHSNYVHWNGHFAYLLVDEIVSPPPPQQLHIEKEIDVECVAGVQPPAMKPIGGVFCTDIMPPVVITEIDETVESLVRLMLRTQKQCCPMQSAPPPPLEQSRMENGMVAQLQRLVRTLALLVYNSPVLRTIHADQLHARQRRTPTAQVFVPEQVIAPGDMCVALLFSLLTEAYCDRDHYDQTVLWWSANPWLAHLAQSGVIARILADAGKRHRHKRRRLAPLGEKERMARTVVDVKDALAHYQGHAFWVRNFILTNK